MREIFATNVPAGASLGYTLYLAGAPVGVRTTAGIMPVGSGTGIYRTFIDDGTCDLVVWDTGGSRPAFSAEQISPGVVTPTVGTSTVTPTLGGGAVTVLTPILGGH